MEYAITDNNEEIRRIARRIMADKPGRYPGTMLDDFVGTFRTFLPEKKLEELFYEAIYHQQMYGTSLLEYAMYGFRTLSHARKAEYVTWFSRFVYMAFLNKAGVTHPPYLRS